MTSFIQPKMFERVDPGYPAYPGVVMIGAGASAARITFKKNSKVHSA